MMQSLTLSAALILALVELVGCSQGVAADPKTGEPLAYVEAKADDARAFAAPEKVGVLPDSRIVYRVQVTYVPCVFDYDKGCLHSPHWVYFAGSDVTDNHTNQHGKYRSDEVQVSLGDKDSANYKATVAEQQRQQELETLRELKAKYEGAK
jgi:hypothetical protein